MRSAPGGSAEPYRNEQGGHTLKRVLIVFLIGLLAWTLAGRLYSPATGITSAPTIEALKPLAALLTNRVVVVDALTITIAGYTGDLRAAVLVRGDALVSVDLTRARIEDVDRDARTAVIILPPPHVVSARVDHEHTRIFAIESTGLWALVPSDDGRAEIIDRAMGKAQQAVFRAANEPLVIEQARERAEGLIRSFFAESLKWTVTVCWADEPGVR